MGVDLDLDLDIRKKKNIKNRIIVGEGGVLELLVRNEHSFVKSLMIFIKIKENKRKLFQMIARSLT